MKAGVFAPRARPPLASADALVQRLQRLFAAREEFDGLPREVQRGMIAATGAAVYTVAYRLERVRELTGLDSVLSEDRERLGLGLKAYRIIAPRLPR